MSFRVPDRQSTLVVLLLQSSRIHGHILLHFTQEKQPDIIPSRLPPRHHVPSLVDRSQVGGGRPMYDFTHSLCIVTCISPIFNVVLTFFSILRSSHQQLHPRRDVHVLRSVSARTSHAEVPLVEEIPDRHATCEYRNNPCCSLYRSTCTPYMYVRYIDSLPSCPKHVDRYSHHYASSRLQLSHVKCKVCISLNV